MEARKILLTLFFLGLYAGISAQNRGVVYDGKTMQRLEGVNIYLFKDTTGVGITDESGEFEVSLLSGLSEQDTLVFSYVGYETLKLSLGALREKDYLIVLSNKIQQLEEVTITGKTLKEYLHWEAETTIPHSKGLFAYASAVVGNKIYIAGGDESYIYIPKFYGEKEIRIEFYNRKLYIYDTSTKEWTVSRCKLKARAYHNAHCYDGKIYLFGGKNLSTNRRLEYLEATTEIYDIEKDTVIVDPVNPHQAVNFASFIFDNKAFVFGGSDKQYMNGKSYSNKGYMFDFKTGYWYELQPMPYAKEAKGILVDSVFYLLCGYGNGKPLFYIETYNLQTGQWHDVGRLPVRMARPGIVYNGGLIYLYERSKLQVYDIKSQKVRVYRADVPVADAELFCIGKKLYIIGGATYSDDDIYPSPLVFSLDLDELEKTEYRDFTAN